MSTIPQHDGSPQCKVIGNGNETARLPGQARRTMEAASVPAEL